VKSSSHPECTWAEVDELHLKWWISSLTCFPNSSPARAHDVKRAYDETLGRSPEVDAYAEADAA
jgi:hypothetical protein